MSQAEKLNNWFSYHPPIADQAQRYEQIRAAGKAMAEKLVELCPESADLTVAIRHIRDAVYSANASIACGGK
jgi:hypothetical protein